MLPLVGESASFAAAPGVTVKAALPAVRPVAEAVIVAVPVVTGVKVVDALPPFANIGDGGLNDPDTPVTANVMEFVAFSTVFPKASCTVAI
jgi:hypothetical protein